MSQSLQYVLCPANCRESFRNWGRGMAYRDNDASHLLSTCDFPSNSSLSYDIFAASHYVIAFKIVPIFSCYAKCLDTNYLRTLQQLES